MAKNKKNVQTIDRPIYGYWAAFYNSFFNPELYVDVAKRWKGFGLVYLFFVLAVTMLPFTMRLSYEVYQEIKIQYIEPLESLPLLFVHDGKLNFDKPMPYLIKNKHNKVVGIIDTTGTIQTKTKDYPDLIALLQERQIKLWQPSADAFVNSLPTYQQLSIDLSTPNPKAINEILPAMKDSNQMKTAVAPYPGKNEVFDVKASFDKTGFKKIITLFIILIYPLMVLFIFMLVYSLLLIFAMMGQLLSSLFLSFNIKYSQAVRILAVAFTPSISLLWFSFFFNFAFPGIGLLLFVVAILYFFYGVIAYKREARKVVRL